MKKSILTIVATLTISVLTFAAPSGDNNDKNTATHNVSIEIPTIAIIDVEAADGEASTINLVPNISSLEAGEAVDFETASNSDLWLNYSSIVQGGNPRTISASISGNLPNNLGLYLTIGNYDGNGKGKTGLVANSAPQELTINSKNIIHDIKSCYTGNGINNGHNLKYALKVKDGNNYQNINAGSYDVTITYTITAN